MHGIHIPLRILFAATILYAASARAQTVTGRVVDSATGEPVPGAVVLLRGEDGSERRSLADASGQYTIRAMAAGTYTVAAERVGYQSTSSAPIRLAQGKTVRHELRAGSRRVVLDAITATARPRRCAGDVRRGPEAQVLWEEARKVVAAAALTQEREDVAFVTRMHRRHQLLRDRSPYREVEWTVTTSGPPFRAESGENLVDGGYVVFGGDSAVFRGIDAHAILSDAFVRHHCFSVREGGSDRPAEVGLEFMPLRGTRVPDVQGVLWLDRASAELRVVEYRFTGLAYGGPVERLGGRLRFAPLPDGGWMIRDWIVDAPIVVDVTASRRAGNFPTVRVRGIVQTGGEVMEVRGNAPPSAADGQR